MSKHGERQKLIRHYKQETGAKEIDMEEVARFAVRKGWLLPDPVDPIKRLAEDFARSAREEMRTDKKTGRPYRANHVYSGWRDGNQTHLWVDIDEAPRGPMQASVTMRREQIVGDITQLSFDAEHWNRINPLSEPIAIETDFGPDVEWRRNTPDEKAG